MGQKEPAILILPFRYLHPDLVVTTFMCQNFKTRLSSTMCLNLSLGNYNLAEALDLQKNPAAVLDE